LLDGAGVLGREQCRRAHREREDGEENVTSHIRSRLRVAGETSAPREALTA
jgi:hypothetical protein